MNTTTMPSRSGSPHALVDVVLAEAGPDGPLLDLEDRRRQRAGPQQQCEVAGLEQDRAR